MFRHRTAPDELARLEAFHSFLRSELTREVRHAVKAVQKVYKHLQIIFSHIKIDAYLIPYRLLIFYQVRVRHIRRELVSRVNHL